MKKKKKIELIAGCLAVLTTIILYALSFSNLAISEQKISHFLYNDQPTEAIREIKILLFFHPTNVYAKRMQELLTSDKIHFP